MDIKSNQKLCELCEEISRYLCLKCNSYFCESCYKFVHEKKKNAKHKKEDIDPYVPIETKCSKHQDIPINLFCINEKELCCSICQFLKPHDGHKLLLINDEESLKKENITLDTTTNDYEENIKDMNDLKQEIEKEIIKINNLYENINKEVGTFYKEKQKKLKEEENSLIEKLQNEVTKIKEKLENFLSECNNIIKINERLSKGIKKMKEEKDNNMRKLLSYVSTISKNQKKVNLLLSQPISNLKISFEKEKSNIKYEEYYFNSPNKLLSNLLNENDKQLLISWLPNRPSKISLLFDTTKDGDNFSTFHDKCDNKYPTLILIKSNTGYIFGGYVSSAWNCNNNNINASNSFIFSLNQKAKYNASSEQNSIINGGTRNNQKDSIMFKIGCCDIHIKHNCT